MGDDGCAKAGTARPGATDLEARAGGGVEGNGGGAPVWHVVPQGAKVKKEAPGWGSGWSLSMRARGGWSSS